MSDPLLVGIDVGTQSAKVGVYDRAGTLVASGRRALRPMVSPQPGTALHPDDDLWDALVAASSDAMAALGDRRADIVAVGLCPIRCCKAFMRSDGSLVEPVMSWMDHRAYTPYVPAADDLAWASTLGGYLTHRLTGVFRDTAANAVLQWPLDTDTWTWDLDPVAQRVSGTSPSMLAELRLPGEVLGEVTTPAAAATGLPIGVPVVATANDKAVEMLGAGALGDGEVLLSLGTYIAAMVHGAVNHQSPTAFWTNLACIPHRYLYESAGIRHGMATVTWFLDLLGPEFAAAAVARGVSREEYIEPEAAAVTPGSDGVIALLDWLAAPQKPFRRGALLGLRGAHSRGHVYRAILEAIVLTMHRNIELMCAETGTRPERIVVSGGGSNGELMMRIVADVSGLPVARASGGAALGSAACAAAGIGLYPTIEEAAAAMAPPRRWWEPDAEGNERYRAVAGAGFHDLHRFTDPLFRHLSQGDSHAAQR